MNGVFIIPTGIGCAIGGHAGDAVCAVNLIASLCENLIVNPNAVNASDINEMAPNCLYVEGSMIDRFLADEFGLEKRIRNDILLAVNGPVHAHTVNSVNAARVALGIEIEIMELETPLTMYAGFAGDGTAGGHVGGWRELLDQVRDYVFDALAIQTEIYANDDAVARYLERGGVNPWGGVEAKASRLIAEQLGAPVAHAPKEHDGGYFSDYVGVTNPRMAAEMVSVSYLHCVLKGLSRAPTPSTLRPYLRVQDIEFLVTPDGCFGTPHELALYSGIEVIVVRENSSILSNEFPPECTFVENYLECAGLIACRKIGINERWVRT